MTLSIALIGDYDEQRVVAHRAIPHALEFGNSALGSNLVWEWIKTAELPKQVSTRLGEFSGIWVVPGSPYENTEGVLDAIRFAREGGKPFLGTCGGFQHALIEYARNVCGIECAGHAEMQGDAKELIISPLSCSLIGEVGQIRFSHGSLLHQILGNHSDLEEYHCNYGLNAMYRKTLENAGIHFVGFDESGGVRAFEIPNHPFYIGTLFQPERAALRVIAHPLVTAFMNSIIRSNQD